MEIIDYIDADTEQMAQVIGNLEGKLSLEHMADIWMACGYKRTELRNIGWKRGQEVLVQVVPVSVVTGGRIA